MITRKIIQIHPILLCIIKIWNSVSEAVLSLNLNKCDIFKVCNCKLNHAGGYYWKYYDDYIKEICNNQYIKCYPSSNNLFNNSFICNPFYLTNNMNGYINPCYTFNPNEIWKDIEGYEGLYKISNFGRVLSYCNYPYIYLLKPQLDNKKYYQVTLYNNNDKKSLRIHRLVAQAFILNPNNLPMINHKDEIKNNNFYENLEWCDAKYNSNYGTAIERTIKANSKPVQQIDLETGEVIGEFCSASEAFKNTNIYHISKVCLGKYKSAGGFGWRFKQ